MEIKNLLLLVISVLNLLLGYLIISKKRNSISVTYSLIVIWGAIWTFGLAMFRHTADLQSMFFWNKLFIFSSSFVAGTLLHFSFIFPYEKNHLNTIKTVFIYLTSSIFALSAIFPGVMIKKIVINDWGNESILGWGYIYFALYFSIYSLWSFMNLWRKHKESSRVFKNQILYVLIGLIISIVFAATFNLIFILLGNYKYIWLGPFASFIFFAFTGYSIIAHRFLDIKVVLRKSTVYISSLLTIILPALLIRYFINHNYPSFLSFADFLILIISLAIFAPVRSFYYRLANKYFFTSLYDSKTVISKLSNSLRTTLNVDKIYKIIDETLTGAFHAKAVGFVRYDKTNCEYHMSYNNGFENQGRTEFPGNRLLHDNYISKGKSIIVEDIKNLPDKNYNATIKMLSMLKIEILTPLNIKDKTIGLIALGQKETGDMYNDEDIGVMEIIGAQAAIALENATLYEKVKRFNIKLKKEIAKATEDLVLANEQLKKLDQAKSEFISIASHQLRTPLTVVKGYVSMILERNFGEIGEKQVEPLEKVYLSNERLIQLVENLLNVSRIESGRLQFSYTEFQLEDMVDSVVEELSNYAKKKGLKLIWDRPASPLPKVYIDEEKIRQVVMNLTDNAIKYTKQGSVTVTLKQIDDNLQFCVSDSGMGILATDLPNLFQKFSRGTGTSLVHTEGTGLGLYVARQMIEAHKGKTWAESDGEYKGSRFYFTLPIIK